MNTNKINHKSNRTNSSGHILIYRPDHPSAYTSKNWEGYVYEHRFIAEQNLKRSLRDDEEVHHLNLNPADNRWENLMIISRESHAKLHVWLDSGAPGYESSRQKGMNSGKPNLHEHTKRCKICNLTLSRDQSTYCGIVCHGIDLAGKSKRPSPEVLKADMERLSGNMSAVGRKYDVSDNTVRKWIKRFIVKGVWQS